MFPWVWAEAMVEVTYGANFVLYVSASSQGVDIYHVTPLPYNCMAQHSVGGSTVLLAHANSLPMMGDVGACYCAVAARYALAVC